MNTPARAALELFEAALEQLLAVHGAQLGERSRVTFDRRPGVFVLSEADGDTGHQPRLLILADHREPESYGRRLDDSC